MIPDTERFLLARARAAIAAHLAHIPLAPADEVPEEAEAPMGCFVTLSSEDDTLRGCVGTFAASEPLWRAVEAMAVAAASRDPRFPPLSREELEHCVIDISALSPPHRCTPAQVRVGLHGVVIEGRGRRGVLLPRVATERGWDAPTFLEHTCRKAGLGPQAYREPDVEVSIFTARVFTEAH